MVPDVASMMPPVWLMVPFAIKVLLASDKVPAVSERAPCSFRLPPKVATVPVPAMVRLL